MYEDDPEILRPVLAHFAPGCGAWVDCAEGWWPIIAQLDRDITAVAPDYRVLQINEKFGGLRFYFAAEDSDRCDQIHELVRAAEQVAARTCEFCGAPGRARGGGWIKTLCDTHVAGSTAR
jgi:hypothetical protein